MDDNFKVNTDWFLEIGSTHKICEDYVIAGDWYAILSDGCSSSVNTDVGSRILCLSTVDILNRIVKNCSKVNYPNYWEFGKMVINNAYPILKQLNLPLETLDATLIVSFTHYDNIITYVYGDGYVLFEFSDGRVSYTKYDYTSNAPFYLSYQLDPHRMRLYEQLVDNIKHKYSCEMDKINEQSNWKIAASHPYDAECVFKYPMNQLKTVVISSDGLGSFTECNQGQRVNIKDKILADSVMAFKNKKGEFLRRRLNRMMAELKINNTNLQHYDDISFAGININCPNQIIHEAQNC